LVEWFKVKTLEFKPQYHKKKVILNSTLIISIIRYTLDCCLLSVLSSSVVSFQYLCICLYFIQCQRSCRKTYNGDEDLNDVVLLSKFSIFPPVGNH
jgi:hypothetical protein